jgi:putative Holliday junction resolvase
VTETGKSVVIEIEQVPALIARGQRLMGIDLGTKTIGLAISDVEWRFATPLSVIIRRKFTPDVAAMAEVVQRHSIGCLVFGLPLNMDGSIGPRAQATQAFVRNLERLLPLPVVMWDERLSTVAAERTLLEANLSRAKRAAVIDRGAAAFILQGALDRLRFLGSTPQAVG